MSGNKSNNGQSRRKGRRRRKSKKSEGAKAAEFWGAEGTTIDLEHDVILAQDATSVVQSLGGPPLLSHQSAGEVYFQAVYARAAALSGALAAAGDLIDPSEDQA